MSKATVEELEAILNNPKAGTIEIMPDGSIRSIRGDETAALRQQIEAALSRLGVLHAPDCAGPLDGDSCGCVYSELRNILGDATKGALQSDKEG